MPTSTPTLFYLTRHMSRPDGDHIACTKLHQSLQQHYRVTTAYMVESDATKANAAPHIAAMMITESEILAEPHPILIVEGNFGQMVDSLDYPTSRCQPRVRAGFLRELTARGGIALLIMISTTGTPEAYNRFHQAAGVPGFYVTTPGSYTRGSGPAGRAPIALDVPHRKNYDGSIFEVVVDEPYLQWVEEDLRPIYHGVQRLLLSSPHPLELAGPKTVVAGNPTTQFLASDEYVDGAPPIFGTLYERSGGGASVVLTGSMLADSTLETGTSDAILLVLNLLQQLRAA